VQVLFGGKFIEYSALLPIVVAFAISDNVVSTPVTMVAQFTERTAIILESQAFAIYQVIAMLTLIPLGGLYGAAIATGTMHLLRNAYVWWRVRELARWHNWFSAIWQGTGIWAVATVICLLLKHYTASGPLVAMICGVPVFALALVIYLRSAALSGEDRSMLAGLLHGSEAAVLRWLGVLPLAGE
jgi:O-antigen/teichoic acid export membrane protein